MEDQVHIDPRSPSVEFTRTPIALTNAKLIKSVNQPVKLRNKNLDLVRQHFTNFSPMKPHGTNIITVKNKLNKTEVKVNQGPILLAASPYTKKVVDNAILDKEKRKSFLGLLETDLDFVETDLDSVIHNGRKDIVEDDKVIVEEDETDLDNEEQKIVAVDDETIEDPGLKEENTLEMSVKEKLHHNKEAFVSPIKEALEKMSKIDQEIKDVIASVQTSLPPFEMEGDSLSTAFDKKVTNLIYEDQTVPKTLKSATNVANLGTGNRTPLGERNINHNTSSKKSTHKLKVHDQPLNLNKKDYAVSKIPVFKEKKGNNKKALMQQCENTPPRQKLTDQQKPRNTQWDGDNTLII